MIMYRAPAATRRDRLSLISSLAYIDLSHYKILLNALTYIRMQVCVRAREEQKNLVSNYN